MKLLSEYLDRAVNLGSLDRWTKVKNRKHPAFGRVMDAFG